MCWDCKLCASFEPIASNCCGVSSLQMPIGCFSHRWRSPCRLLIYWSLVWGKEFEFLGNFDGRDFVDDVRTSKLVAKMDGKDGHVAVLSCYWLSLQVKKLRDYLVDKYENLEAAMVPNEPHSCFPKGLCLSVWFLVISIIQCGRMPTMPLSRRCLHLTWVEPTWRIFRKRGESDEKVGDLSHKKSTKNASIFIDSINHQTSVDNRQCAVTIMIIIIIIIITTINLYVYV